MSSAESFLEEFDDTPEPSYEQKINMLRTIKAKPWQHAKVEAQEANAQLDDAFRQYFSKDHSPLPDSDRQRNFLYEASSRISHINSGIASHELPLIQDYRKLLQTEPKHVREEKIQKLRILKTAVLRANLEAASALFGVEEKKIEQFMASETTMTAVTRTHVQQGLSHLRSAIRELDQSLGKTTER